MPVSPPSGQVTFYFCDVVGSTKLSAELASEQFASLIARFRERMVGLAGTEGGWVQPKAGDMIFAAFDDPHRALAFAAAAHRSLRDDPITAPNPAGVSRQVQIRSGLYRAACYVAPQGDDYTHHEVNVASRVMAAAAPEQILVSDSAFSATRCGEGHEWEHYPGLRLRDFQEPEMLHELLWDGAKRGEPGIRWLPEWFESRSRYVSRPGLEKQVLDTLGAPNRDGQAVQLVTLHGFGGAGKTRLALECARRLVLLFGRNLKFVSLAGAPTEAEDALLLRFTAEAIGSCFGLPDDALDPERLPDRLPEDRALVVLDNFESVDCDAVAELLTRMLARRPHLYLLVTGRTATKVHDLEQLIPVVRLEEHEALELFLLRTRQHRGAAWEPDAAVQTTIEEILGEIDYHPLAVEIAAAWLRYQTSRQILDGLRGQALSDFTETPPGGRNANASPRHGGLRKTLDWSWNLLKPEDREGLARLGMFAAPFTEDDAYQACGVSLSQLIVLNDHSLVDRTDLGEASHYSLKPPTRQYAAERLGQQPNAVAALGRFAGHYARLIGENWNVNKPEQMAVLRTAWRHGLVAAEVASRHALSKELQTLAFGLRDFLSVGPYTAEAEMLQRTALTDAKVRGLVLGQANCIHNLGVIALRRSDSTTALNCFNEAMPLYQGGGDVLGQANCIHSLGEIARRSSDQATALRRFTEALLLYRQLGNLVGQAHCIRNLGDLALERSAHTSAQAYFEEALPLSQSTGDVLGGANCIRSLGEIALRRSDYATALVHFKKAVVLYQQVGDILGEASCIQGLGDIALRRSEFDVAANRYDEALLLFQRVADIQGQANCTLRLGEMAWLQFDRNRAQAFFGNALSLYQHVGSVLGQANCIQGLGNIALRWSDYDDAVVYFKRALLFYQRAENILGEADCIQGLGDVSRRRSDSQAARTRYEEALALYQQVEAPYPTGVTHAKLAVLTAAEERTRHVSAARAAWLSIGRTDLVARLDAEFGGEGE